MALEMDLYTNDIDICVVSETRLRLLMWLSPCPIMIYTAGTGTGVEGICVKMGELPLTEIM